MPPSDSLVLIVARFLKANRYNESYDAFIREAGLSEDASKVNKGDLTLETLLEEKKTFDLSIQFEKLGTDEDASKEWKIPAPTIPYPLTVLPTSSNLLSVSVESILTDGQGLASMLFTSSADRRLHILDAASQQLRESLLGLHDSPILSSAVLGARILLTTSMSGQLVASDVDGTIIDKRRDHSKYAVKVAVSDAENPTIATAGWDNKVVVYRPTSTPSFNFGEPVATISLPSKPEAMLIIPHPYNDEPILLITRTDSNFIFYYTTEPEPRLLGKQNLAPHSNAWVAFTPSSIDVCPADPSLVAVGTSSVPHMKLLIVRLLIPPYLPSDAPSGPVAVRASLLDDTPVTETQASQARAALAIADREDAAIQIHCTTFAPQTAYSTPSVMWRPDGSGVWVNGDDGAIRGIEASTGKVITTLKGHEDGSKVRCLWAGNVDSVEWLVSGGFDQKLIVWRK